MTRRAMEIRPFVLIQDWMLDLDLTASETIAVAIVYGFTQDGEHTCHASVDYFGRMCKMSRRGTVYMLRRLVERGVLNVERSNGGVNEYSLGEGCKNCTGAKTARVQNDAERGAKTARLSPFLSPTPPIYSSIQEKKEKIESPRERACEAEPRTSPAPDEGTIFGETTRAAAAEGGPGASVTAQSQEKKTAARPGRAPFAPPTIAEVREYVAARGSGIDPTAFFAFYENRDWRLSDGRRMKDWRLAVVTWERRDRNGRRY